MPILLEELSNWDYTTAYVGNFSSGDLVNGFYFGPTKERQATIFSKKVALIADNAANASLNDIYAILALNVHLCQPRGNQSGSLLVDDSHGGVGPREGQVGQVDMGICECDDCQLDSHKGEGAK